MNKFYVNILRQIEIVEIFKILAKMLLRIQISRFAGNNKNL